MKKLRFNLLASTLLFFAFNQIQALTAQSAGLYKELSSNLYWGIIYSDTNDKTQWKNGKAPLILELRIVKDKLTKRQFIKIWNEGLAINLSKEEVARYTPQLQDLAQSIRSNLIKGDIIQIDNKNNNTIVRINSSQVYQHSDKNFTTYLLNAWIGRFTTSPEFKNELLDQSKITLKNKMNLALSFKPTGNRITLISSWNSPKTIISSLPDSKPNLKPTPIITERQKLNSDILKSNDSITKPNVKPSITDNKKTKNGSQSAPPNDNDTHSISSQKKRNDSERKNDIARNNILIKMYHAAIAKKIKDNLHYNPIYVRRAMEGTVVISVTIDKTGKLIKASINKNAPYQELDNEALRAVRASAPYPKLPEALTSDSLNFYLPFEFNLARYRAR